MWVMTSPPRWLARTPATAPEAGTLPYHTAWFWFRRYVRHKPGEHR